MNKEYSFKIVNNEICVDGIVVYQDEEIFFDTDNKIKGRIFSLMIGKGYNTFDFSVIKNKAQWFGGYNSSKNWINSNLIFPQYQKGEIYIENNLENIMDGQWYVENWKTYYDKKQNILCIGNYNTNPEDIAIEFCTNIIAVFEEKYLKSIWIKEISFK